MKGSVDEIRIWIGARSREEIREHMYRRLGEPYPDSLISYVNMQAQPSISATSHVADDLPFEGILRGTLAQASIGICRDLVTNLPVQLDGVGLVPSTIPTGSSDVLPRGGEVAVFQEPGFKGSSWLFPENPLEFDVRADLSTCAIGSLKVGDRTGATIFDGEHFTGTSQETMSDLPAIDCTRLAKKPLKSIHVWSTNGRAHRGSWAIQASAGSYLGAKPDEDGRIPLGRGAIVDEEGLFRIEEAGSQSSTEGTVAIRSPFHNSYLTPQEDGSVVFCDPRVTDRCRWIMRREQRQHDFSLVTLDGKRWLAARPRGGFELSDDEAEREIFTLAFQVAGDEGEVGELQEGEAAFYEKPCYWGRAWIFHAKQSDLRVLHEPGFTAASVRFGPNTCATFFDKPGFSSTENAADVLLDAADISSTGFEGKQIASFRIWQTVSPGAVGLEFTASLSEDVRPVPGKTEHERYSAYRANIGLPENAQTLEIGVSYESLLEINGSEHHLRAGESCTVEPNSFARVIVTGEAQHLFAPALRVRTDTMSLDQHVVIHPDQDAQRQWKKRTKEGQLWDAKDRGGNRVLQDGLTEDGAGAVQSAVGAMMSTANYAQSAIDASDAEGGEAPVQEIGEGELPDPSRWITERGEVASGGLPGQGFRLDFDVKIGRGGRKPAARQPVFTIIRDGKELSEIWPELGGTLPDLAGLPVLSFGDFWDKLKEVGEIARIVVIKIKDTASAILVKIVQLAKEAMEFVVDTASKVVAIVEKIIEQVVTAVAKFIEWLAFLFDWDDILETQDELRTHILEVFAIASNLLRDAQKQVDSKLEDLSNQIPQLLAPVRKHFQDQKPAVNDGQNRARSARNEEADEKMQWFLGKTSGGEAAGALWAQAAAVSYPKPPEAIQRFVDSLGDLIDTVVDDEVAGALRSALHRFSLVISGPNSSLDLDQLILGLLDVLEALARGGINLVRAIFDKLCDVVDEALRWFEEMLKYEWPIWGVKEFFSWITKGQKLNVLNVATLAAAIPATIIYKFVTSLLDSDDPEVRAYLPAGVPVRRAGDSEDQDEEKKKLWWGIVYTGISVVHGALSMVLDAFGAAQMAKKYLEDLAKGKIKKEKLGWTDEHEVLDGMAKRGEISKTRYWKMDLPDSPWLEGFAWVLELGMLICSWPGGYPFAKSTKEFFPKDDPAEWWDDFLYTYEGIWFLLEPLSIAIFKKKMRRADERMNVVASILGGLHLIFVLVVMFQEISHKSDWYKKNVVPLKTIQAVSGTLPEIGAFMLNPRLVTKSQWWLLVYLGIEYVAVVIDASFNTIMAVNGLIDPPED